MNNAISKREQEKQLVGEMIDAYCRHQHGTPKGRLCPECAALAAYARERSEHCPFMEHKTYCNNCPVHCYRPEMRQRIKAVMAYAGPRLFFHHPFKALDHLVKVKIEKRFLKNR